MQPSPAAPNENPLREQIERLVRSRAFRRMAGKTQVVPLPRADHVRTRLTHVLEVATLSRRIARALRRNEDLAEAIALAHDLGHPPFGHVGERVLAHASGSFHHATHGVRLVEQLEPLGLSPEVRAGILLHSKGRGAIVAPRTHAELPHATPEAALVRIADLIAYASHDTDDAGRLGYLHESDLPRWVRAFLSQKGGEGSLPTRVARAFASDVVEASRARPEVPAVMSEEGEAALDAMRGVLYARYYERAELLAYVPRIREVLLAVYEASLRGRSPREALDRVAGMTDRRAISEYQALMRTRLRRARAARAIGTLAIESSVASKSLE